MSAIVVTTLGLTCGLVLVKVLTPVFPRGEASRPLTSMITMETLDPKPTHVSVTVKVPLGVPIEGQNQMAFCAPLS